jgi:class 3 adenylate cyclase
LVEFRSVVDAVRCAVEVQNAMVERNAGVPPERRIEFRVGIHLGDVVFERVTATTTLAATGMSMPRPAISTVGSRWASRKAGTRKA